MGANYKMIGNAVPPKFAKVLGTVLAKQLDALTNKSAQLNPRKIEKTLFR